MDSSLSPLGSVPCLVIIVGAGGDRELDNALSETNFCGLGRGICEEVESSVTMSLAAESFLDEDSSLVPLLTGHCSVNVLEAVALLRGTGGLDLSGLSSFLSTLSSVGFRVIQNGAPPFTSGAAVSSVGESQSVSEEEEASDFLLLCRVIHDRPEGFVWTLIVSVSVASTFPSERSNKSAKNQRDSKKNAQPIFLMAILNLSQFQR